MKKKTIRIQDTERQKWQCHGFSAFLKEAFLTLHNENLDDEDIEIFERYQLKDCAGKIFLPQNISPDGIHEEFSILTHHKSNFHTPHYIPQLTLGTVVRTQGPRPKYFFCIQQRCDSLRIEKNEKRNFIFLPMFPDNKKVDVVFKHKQKGYIFLKCPTNSCYNIMVIPFLATNKKSVVSASKDTRKQYFFTSVNGERYYWVLDLKESHAQRIIERFASTLSRIGLDESEWLRRL
jgi:hypothetical protein